VSNAEHAVDVVPDAAAEGRRVDFSAVAHTGRVDKHVMVNIYCLHLVLYVICMYNWDFFYTGMGMRNEEKDLRKI